MEMVHFIPPSQRRIALMAAQADTAPVLIHGGAGTGKGAIAKWIHTHGPRAGQPLITANASHDESLAESFKRAQGGTLVIHEIGEWNLSDQKMLLTYLTNKSVKIPGEDGTLMTMLLNVRIMATTSQVLEGRAQGGLFNSELLGKLNVYRLEMPPLLQRTEEFDDIVQGILGEITRELHKEHLKGLSPDAWHRMRGYEWPGNLRELRNVLRVAIIAAQGDEIQAGDLPDFGHDRIDFRATREEFEKTYLLEILKTFDWQIDKTCQVTRMDRTTLLTKMNRYGIATPSQLPHP
jgi:DNA-binding NtrC family response regulator